MKRTVTRCGLIILCASIITMSPLLASAGEKKEGKVSVPEAVRTGFESISSDDLKMIVETLSSDLFAGREADAFGGSLAAVFIQSWLSDAGLEGWKAGETTVPFAQVINCAAADVDLENSSLSVKTKDTDAEKIYKLESEVFYSPQSPENLSLSAPVVFAGFGIDAPEYRYNDYTGIDLKGKIAIVYNHEPQEKDERSIFRGAKATRYSMPQIKARIAQEKGAVALIIMRDRNNPHASMGETLAMRGRKEERGHFLGIEGEEPLIPIFYIEDAVADEIFKGSGIDLKKKQSEIDTNLKSEPVSLSGVTLTLAVKMENRKEIHLKNIITKIGGTDDALKNEAVIVGAHYDHLGKKPEGMYPGADDNASGVAALLNIARAVRINPLQPRRTVYFVFFTAEEKGVIGSKYLSSHLPVPKEDISAMLNLDELGRNNMDKDENAMMAIAFTSGQSPELKKIVKKCNDLVGLDMKYYPTLRFLMNSDHSVFHDMGIPVIFFFSGFHKDYHTTTDTADKINYLKLDALTRLIYLPVWDIANRPEKIRFDPSITKEPDKDDFAMPF